MHIKHIHCMIEELSSGLKENVTTCMKPEEVGIVGAAVDMLKDLCEAEYYARMAKCLEKAEEEDEEEEKYLLRKLKEEYGDEEGERRYYDDYRYKRSGRFAPKGRGSYMPRSGYEEPPYYHMTPEQYREHDPEYYRDMDRNMGKMYFTEPITMNASRSNMGGMRDSREESRYEKAKRGYQETKAMHKGNTPEDKQLTMREAEKMLNVVFDEIDEMLEDATPEMKNMVKTKGMTRFQKIQ